MLNKRGVCGVVVIILLVTAGPLQAGNSLLEGDRRAGIDWKKGLVGARGYGVASSNIRSEAQLVMLAREAAITVARRRLLGEIGGIRINSYQKIKDAQLESDVIINQIKKRVKKAEIVEEERIAENAYMVVIEVGFYGEKGIIKTVLPYLKEERNRELAEVSGDQFNEGEDKKVTGNLEEYTGIIIDTFNLEVKPALAPRIYSPAGEVIYGVSKVGPERIIKKGIIGYEDSLANAKSNSRIGTKPLIITAAKTVGDYKTDLVLSSKDAKLLKEAGEINNIFNKCKVIIVLN